MAQRPKGSDFYPEEVVVTADSPDLLSFPFLLGATGEGRNCRPGV
jgi:hypothetical protein